MNIPFQAAFEHMPTPAVIIHKESGGITFMNASFDNFFRKVGAKPQSNWCKLVEDCTPADWEKLVNLASSHQIERISVLLTVGTQTVPAEMDIKPLDDTHLLAFISSTENLDLSSAENTLLKFALTESSAGLWLWEVDENRISCSPSIATLLGCAQENTPHSTEEWHALIHKDDVNKLVRTVNEHIEHKQKYYETDYRIRRANDEYIWVKERGRTYTYDVDGNIKKVIGFVEDISHQKALEEYLRSQATFDELTGLLNRGAALTHFTKQLGLAKRQYTPLTMAKIDLDARGLLADMPLERRNTAIHASARYIYKKVREADILARVAHDKLLLLLPNTSIKDATRLVKGILSPSDEEQKVLAFSEASHENLCVGLATFPEDGETIEELAQSANTAVEKGRGKGIAISVME